MDVTARAPGPQLQAAPLHVPSQACWFPKHPAPAGLAAPGGTAGGQHMLRAWPAPLLPGVPAHHFLFPLLEPQACEPPRPRPGTPPAPGPLASYLPLIAPSRHHLHHLQGGWWAGPQGQDSSQTALRQGPSPGEESCVLRIEVPWLRTAGLRRRGAWRWGAAGGAGTWVALQRVHAIPPPCACPWARAVVPSLSVSTGPSDPPLPSLLAQPTPSCPHRHPGAHHHFRSQLGGSGCWRCPWVPASCSLAVPSA